MRKPTLKPAPKRQLFEPVSEMGLDLDISETENFFVYTAGAVALAGGVTVGTLLRHEREGRVDLKSLRSIVEYLNRPKHEPLLHLKKGDAVVAESWLGNADMLKYAIVIDSRIRGCPGDYVGTGLSCGQGRYELLSLMQVRTYDTEYVKLDSGWRAEALKQRKAALATERGKRGMRP